MVVVVGCVVGVWVFVAVCLFGCFCLFFNYFLLVLNKKVTYQS